LSSARRASRLANTANSGQRQQARRLQQGDDVLDLALAPDEARQREWQRTNLPATGLDEVAVARRIQKPRALLLGQTKRLHESPRRLSLWRATRAPLEVRNSASTQTSSCSEIGLRQVRSFSVALE
jgi:hypothetical protein